MPKDKDEEQTQYNATGENGLTKVLVMIRSSQHQGLRDLAHEKTRRGEQTSMSELVRRSLEHTYNIR